VLGCRPSPIPHLVVWLQCLLAPASLHVPLPVPPSPALPSSPLLACSPSLLPSVFPPSRPSLPSSCSHSLSLNLSSPSSVLPLVAPSSPPLFLQLPPVPLSPSLLLSPTLLSPFLLSSIAVPQELLFTSYYFPWSRAVAVGGGHTQAHLCTAQHNSHGAASSCLRATSTQKVYAWRRRRKEKVQHPAKRSQDLKAC